MLPSETLVFEILKSEADFPISFDDAWEWLEFSRKDNAMQSFRNAEFLEGEDFRFFLNNQEKSGRGRPLTEIQLTIDCFKTWAMMVNTSKGKEVRKYFLECEKRLKELLISQKEENRKSIQKKLVAAMVDDDPISKYPKFDEEFYRLLYQKRGNGWEKRSPYDRPPCVGTWTNQCVYDRLLGGKEAGGVKDRLEQVNPKINGVRKDRHHWHLKLLGEYHLNTHLEVLKALARIAPDGDWDAFIYLVKKGLPNGEPLQLELLNLLNCIE